MRSPRGPAGRDSRPVCLAHGRLPCLPSDVRRSCPSFGWRHPCPHAGSRAAGPSPIHVTMDVHRPNSLPLGVVRPRHITTSCRQRAMQDNANNPPSQLPPSTPSPSAALLRCPSRPSSTCGPGLHGGTIFPVCPPCLQMLVLPSGPQHCTPQAASCIKKILPSTMKATFPVRSVPP